MPQPKCIPYRPHDYMYDPIFTVSGPVDHYKAAIVAKMSSVKFQLCPVFPNMFSDLPNHPRMQLVQRRSKPVMSYKEKLDGSREKDPALNKPVDVRGSDRAKFFCPVVNLPPKDFQDCTSQMPIFTIQRKKSDSGGGVSRGTTATIVKEVDGEKIIMKDAEVETMYRESAAQTIPWEPDYKVIGTGDPEILKLDFLKWGSGLPAGMHEVRLIERARMKRAWENVIKPDINDESSLAKFRDFVEALERDEWAFREKEIQEIQDLRLHLLEKMLDEIHQASYTRGEQKLNNFIQRQEKEKQEKLEKIRKKAARELRKLEQEQRGYERKYRETNIVEEHVSKRSELYGPLLRNGENPKRWHHVIDERMKKYKAQFIGVEQFSTLPRWLDQATFLTETECKPKNTGPQLCIRETKWTAKVLKELHEELQNLRKESVKKPCNLRVRNERTIQEIETPEVEGIPEEQEEQYQAIIFMQSLIKGRAIQMMIYEGRDNCKELIKELKNSIGLLKNQKETRSREKMKVRAQQREEAIQSVMVSRLQGTLGKLQGQVVGTVLDFLNKELRRLLEERKAHAMCWVNERERNIREAAEAGRRQKEIRRRKEHDEIFKQIVKVSQESVDVYLHDIITEGMEFATKAEATNYVLKLATKIENEIQEIDKAKIQISFDDQDEMIADMVHHFVLPEVQKNIVRQKRVAKQRQNLKTIHEAVYSQIEDDLPKIKKDESIMAQPSLSDLIGIESEGMFMYTTHEESMGSPGRAISEYKHHPDILELYLNKLAKEEEMAEHEFNLDLPENELQRPYQRGFAMDLETIPETNESVTTDSHHSTEIAKRPSIELERQSLDAEDDFTFQDEKAIFNDDEEKIQLEFDEELVKKEDEQPSKQLDELQDDEHNVILDQKQISQNLEENETDEESEARDRKESLQNLEINETEEIANFDDQQGKNEIEDNIQPKTEINEIDQPENDINETDNTQKVDIKVSIKTQDTEELEENDNIHQEIKEEAHGTQEIEETETNIEIAQNENTGMKTEPINEEEGK